MNICSEQINTCSVPVQYLLPPIQNSLFTMTSKKKRGKANNSDRLTSEIIRASKSIRRKHLALKLGRSEYDTLLSKHFKPISEPLKKVLEQTTSTVIKQEPKIEPKDEKMDHKLDMISVVSPPKIQIERPTINRGVQVLPSTSNKSVQSEDDVLALTTAQQPIDPERSFEQFRNEYRDLLVQNPERIDEYLDQYDVLPGSYLDGLMRDTEGEYDLATGVHFDSVTNNFKIGNSILEIDGRDIVINGIRYKGTGGLYELIFKARPEGYSSEDQDRYRAILKQTSVHRRDFDSQKQVKGSKSYKYVNIIRPLTLSRASSTSGRIEGSGHLGEKLIYSERPYQYVFYDDVNEIINRLRLLMTSKNVGHTGHENEIASIIEELREANVIE